MFESLCFLQSLFFFEINQAFNHSCNKLLIVSFVLTKMLKSFTVKFIVPVSPIILYSSTSFLYN